MAARLRVLAIAVASGRIGHVFLIGGKLYDWGLSRKASTTPALAAKHTTKLIDDLTPDVVVTEKIEKSTRKQKKSRSLIEAVSRTAARATLLDVAVPRLQMFKNKYEEAASLAVSFPELRPWLPKLPKIWEKEPLNTIYWEALGLALVAIETPDDLLIPSRH